MRDGHTMKAVIPGGSSVPILLPDQIDIPASFDDVQQAGSLLGSAAIMVLDDTVDMVWLAENLLHFYRHESCGKCTPCREGTDWLYRLLHRMLDGEGSTRDITLLQERRRPDQRQDAVRLRRRGGDAGADHAEAVQERVRGLRARRAARGGRLPRRPAGRRASLDAEPRHRRHARLASLPVSSAQQLVGGLRRAGRRRCSSRCRSPRR